MQTSYLLRVFVLYHVLEATPGDNRESTCFINMYNNKSFHTHESRFKSRCELNDTCISLSIRLFGGGGGGGGDRRLSTNNDATSVAT